jgi:lipopolysaccharide/colanic/teichoic acid biosynthesis glycosyltransferase
MYRHFFKRIFDLLFSFTGLLIAFPVFLLVTGLLAFANKGKPFFFQPRPGKNEKVFRIVKLKTMNDKRDQAGNLLPDSNRFLPVTRLPLILKYLTCA